MPKEQYMCQLCANHGIFNQPKKGHKQKCPHRTCPCSLCALNTKRRALDQIERSLRSAPQSLPLPTSAASEQSASDRSSSTFPEASPDSSKVGDFKNQENRNGHESSIFPLSFVLENLGNEVQISQASVNPVPVVIDYSLQNSPNKTPPNSPDKYSQSQKKPYSIFHSIEKLVT
ncbi:hypothetical protein WR25_07865 [Diploscapter pachys]|uniref:DM domain-containing protein n=1 Tax=Diploscapter pachys TaxID=2018661 RepID=A0A2A2LGS7_9BILA|nr:hypothetical protein WR25_07865 [Diploscapter pachys]